MDPLAQAGFLDSFFPGPSTPYRPASLLVKLVGAGGDVVLDENGDELAVTVANSSALWDDADGPVKQGDVSFGAPTGEWSEPVAGWRLFDAAVPARLIYGRGFDSPRSVDGASPAPFDVVLTVTTYEVP